MQLNIYLNNKLKFSGEIEKVTVPGLNGLMTILDNHTYLISQLKPGDVTYTKPDGNEESLHGPNGGAIEISDNITTVFLSEGLI